MASTGNCEVVGEIRSLEIPAAVEPSEKKVENSCMPKRRNPGEDEDKTDYRAMIFPLDLIIMNYRNIVSTLPKSKKNATITAFLAELQVLQGVWDFQDPDWLSVREKVNVGIIKDTKTCGNSSVSMGTAVKYFAAHPTEQAVRFINCGSGGNKYQFYVRLDDSVISIAYEHKPKGGSSPGNITVRSYKPDTPMDNMDNLELLNSELKESMNKFETLTGLICGRTFAFVTGKIRNHWEATPADQDYIDANVYAYFKSAGMEIEPAFGSSFLLRQDDEGLLEAIGVTAMYENLKRREFINSDVGVVGVWGIGQGSCQKTSQSPDGQNVINYNFTPGMKNPDQLAMMPYDAVPKLLKDHIRPLIEWIRATGEPVIALKSGGVLFIGSDEGKETLNAIAATPKLEDATVTIPPEFAERLSNIELSMAELRKYLEGTGSSVVVHTS